MNHKAERIIELILLTLIIALHLADFFEIIPGDLDAIKKLISWAILGYLFIRASPTNILMGHKKLRLDIVIILSYFLFTVKDLVGYTQVVIEEMVLLKEMYSPILFNAMIIEKYTFYLGAILLIFVSLYMALKFKIKKPSFMATIHEKGLPPKTIKGFIVRFATIFIVLNAFFILIFNLAIEWVAMALDAPIVVIGIAIYLFIVIRYHKEFHPKNFIYKIGHTGERFYERFIEMFHYKKTLYLGIMGLLALHLLTDIGNFIVPYIIGLKDALYFGHLGTGHTPLIPLLKADLALVQGFGVQALTLVYTLNAIAMIFLLVLPAFIWYRFFKRRKLHITRTTLALAYSSLLCFALTPAFFIKRITNSGLAGVDIQTQSVLQSFSVLDFLIKDKITVITIVAILSILFGIIVWILEFNKRIEKDIFVFAVLIGLTFFGFYIFYYFTSIYQFYIDSIIFLFQSSEYLISFYFIMFAMLTILIYIGGYFLFVYEVFKRYFFK